MVCKYHRKNESIMKKIYIYMVVCMLIGVFMIFRQSLRYVFMEDLNSPSDIELAWVAPVGDVWYKQKILLELQHFNSDLAKDTIKKKIAELNVNTTGIHTLVLSGSPKIDTNTYIRMLTNKDWGVEEIRLHTTSAINIYALVNLIKSSSMLKRVLIWNNKWGEGALGKIRSVLSDKTKLILIKN